MAKNPFKNMTPVEIDTEIKDLVRQQYRAEQYVDWAWDHLHYSVGDKNHYVTKFTKRWDLTNDEVLAKAKDEGYVDSLPSWTRKDLIKALESLQGYVDELAEIVAQIAVRDAEWARRGYWSRFLLVNNANGHIHSSSHCRTCRLRTRYVWLPEMSGLTEKDAVEAYGPVLCSVCFPSAPVEWTEGLKKKIKGLE